jgi:hypothetical protein
MVTKVIIKDNTKSPIYYLEDLPAFKNGKEFIFKEGVNNILKRSGKRRRVKYDTREERYFN